MTFSAQINKPCLNPDLVLTYNLDAVDNMLLLNNCKVHTGNYLDRSFEVRTERSDVRTKYKGPNISRMDRTNWSIRALLHNHNQH